MKPEPVILFLRKMRGLYLKERKITALKLMIFVLFHTVHGFPIQPIVISNSINSIQNINSLVNVLRNPGMDIMEK